MAARQHHIIQQHVFELTSVGMKGARTWECTSAGLVHNVLLPTMDTVFSETVDADTHLVIDKIELDLGVLPSEEIEQALASRLRDALKESLQEQRAHAKASGSVYQSAFVHRKESADEPTPANFLRQEEQAIQAALHFLAYGQLPYWWSLSRPLPNNWADQLTPATASSLRTLLRKSKPARQRLIASFSENSIKTVLAYLGLEDDVLSGWDWLYRWITSDDRPASLPSPSLLPRLYAIYWEAWLDTALGVASHQPNFAEIGRMLPAAASILVQLVEVIQRITDEPLEGDSLRTNQDIPTVVLAMAARGTVLSQPKGIGHEKVDPPNQLPAQPDKDHAGLLDRAQTLEHTSSFASSKDEETDAPDTSSQTVMATLGGLVLLHPFLPELFRDTGLWAEGAFISIEAKTRAVRLLGFLGSGDWGRPEYHLVLPKILCGVPLDQPLEYIGEQQPKEIEACDALLRAVVSHWKKLGNTSPDGLRQAFLLRDALLEPE